MPAFLSFFALHGVLMTFQRHYLVICEQIRNFAAFHKESSLTPKTAKKSMMMKKLTLMSNRARQAKITTELTEIVNGAQQADKM